MVGSTAKAMTYLQYTGEIFALVPGEVQQRLFRLRGLVKASCAPAGDGTYVHTNYDHGLFCDAASGAVIDSWKNPYTAATGRAPVGAVRSIAQFGDANPFLDVHCAMASVDADVTETGFGAVALGCAQDRRSR